MRLKFRHSKPTAFIPDTLEKYPLVITYFFPSNGTFNSCYGDLNTVRILKEAGCTHITTDKNKSFKE